MRIFFFLPQLPYPPHSGGRIVTAPLVEGLSRRHEVHLFALTHGTAGEQEGERELSRQLAGVYTVPGTKRVDVSVLGQSILSRYPYKVHRFARPALARKAAQVAEQHPPDAIHCQNFYTALYGRGLAAKRKVLYQENFETLLLMRWAEAAESRLLRKLIRVEKRRTLAFEMECPLWFDHLVTISDTDQEKYRDAAKAFPDTLRHLEGRLRTIRPSINLPYYDLEKAASLPNPFESSNRVNLAFTGMFGYEANVDGAVWMAKEVMPRLDQAKYSLWLAGQDPSPAVQRLHAPPWIHVTGGVPDIRPYLYHADVSVVPLRIGGGIRLKILEALALGCPVVSTPVGCEGLWRDEDPPMWEVAEEAANFAESIEKACRLPRDRETLHAWVESRFSPERFVRDMEALYRSGEEDP
jgi:glycosyltransferase involved in cell wall biosynthesis